MGSVELRRRARAWFAPRATGEAARRIHAPRARGGAGRGSSAEVVRKHLKGVIEALIFASEHPLPAKELSRIAQGGPQAGQDVAGRARRGVPPRGMRLDEAAGRVRLRTSPVFAPFVREQVAKKPVKMTRAQIETLAIVAYRQPITRPEVDDVRGVDSGAVIKSLLGVGLRAHPRQEGRAGQAHALRDDAAVPRVLRPEGPRRSAHAARVHRALPTSPAAPTSASWARSPRKAAPA